MKNLYHYILQGLEKSPDFYNDQISFEQDLFSLQEPAKSLWQSYRSNSVQVDYSSTEVQAAYLIRYYPHYVQMTLEILRLAPESFVFGEKIKGCFFRAGPCPEIAGLAQFIVENCPETTSLIVNVFDIAFDTWTPSRRLVKNFVLPSIWSGNISGQVNHLDLCGAGAFDSI